MRRTVVLAVLAVASLAAAAALALLGRPATVTPVPSAAGPLSVQAELDRRHLPEGNDAQAYLEVDVRAASDALRRPRVPVNAVLVLDRSGSMAGRKIEQARAAARALVDALGESDRLAVVAFDNEAEVLVPSAEVTSGLKELARSAVARLLPAGETNLMAALDVSGPELRAGRRAGRVDAVFLASDGRVTAGELDLEHLVARARARFGNATLSTFGIGDDYDEDLMAGLASASGGRMQFIRDERELPKAFAQELGRTARLVGTQARLRIRPLAGAAVVRAFGYDADEGWLRLPDFAAGDERRVYVRLAIPKGAGGREVAGVELEYVDADGRARRAEATAGVTFTADARELSEPPGRAAVEGARAEMADMARAAAEHTERGEREEAAEELKAMEAVAGAAPAPELRVAAKKYGVAVSNIRSRGDAAAKAVKQDAFDVARAPVAGW